MNIIDLKNKQKYEEIVRAAEVIKQGGVVLFPTETVYGIGANGLDENAVKKIFETKGRAQDNPLILHISDFKMVKHIAKDITNLEYKLMDAFWPGPFTIILKKKDNVPNVVTGGLDTVAIRMPKNKIANCLIKYANTPIAAPSANISGRPSGTVLEDILEELGAKMDCVIDGGKCEVGIESTVVKVEEGVVRILRPGKITKEQIEQVVDSVILDEHIFEDLKPNDKVLSPGMKYRHYSPKTKCILVYSDDNNAMINKIKEQAKKFSNCTIVCCDENKLEYEKHNILVYGNKNNHEQIAKNIFSILRKVDSFNSDAVFIEGINKSGIGLAIMNRLIRACSHEYIEI
ncbi:MAG: threonylcarbamoyl-AMP synthase [Clostridia bacterium]|nr:threonylcarbamoyl-AMP synthase [Clostridia bacterium]